MKTSPISIFNTHLSGITPPAGMASYTGGASGSNLTIYAIPHGLEVGATYAITGLIVGTSTCVEFPTCKYLGPMSGAPAIGTFQTTGWETI